MVKGFRRSQTQGTTTSGKTTVRKTQGHNQYKISRKDVRMEARKNTKNRMVEALAIKLVSTQTLR
jgi:hypothetical protein